MGFIYVITKHKYFLFILLLFQIYLSKQSKKNQILLSDGINNNIKPFPEDIYKKYEELIKNQKVLGNKIEDMRKKNYDYNLEIEKNKVYIIILYVILTIIILISVILVIIKFYFQCRKKPIPITMIYLKDKSHVNKDI